jgi:hypothetical protein
VNGCALYVNGEEYLPVHPFNVLLRVTGKDKSIKYNNPSAFGITVGVLFPPLGIWYLYKEGSVGRYYKPLFENSLYPALESGGFRPIMIDPGQELTGCLYFILPDEINPYAIAPPDTTEGSEPEIPETPPQLTFPYELAVQPSLLGPFAEGDTLSHMGRNILQAGFANPSGSLYFAVEDYSKSGRTKLLTAGRSSDLFTGAITGLSDLSKVKSKASVMTGTSGSGDIAACALSFKAKSRVYVIQGGDEIVAIGYKNFTKKILNIMFAGEDLLVVTQDGYGHQIRLEGMKTQRKVKLGNAIQDAVIIEDKFLVIGSKELYIYGATGDNLLKRQGKKPLPNGTRTIAGSLGGELAVLYQGGLAAPDTLVLLDPGSAEESSRVPLPGAVNAISSNGRNLLLQLEDGTLADVSLDEGGDSLYADEIAFLPFRVLALTGDREEFMAIGKGGIVARGAMSDFKPVSPKNLSVRTEVVLLQQE